MELRIAIVEDQKFEAQQLERLLRQAWGDPVVCDLYESGDAFLHRAAAGPYAVVFLDICMEGTNGIGTARQLREKDPQSPHRLCDLVAGIRVGSLSGASVRLSAQAV